MRRRWLLLGAALSITSCSVAPLPGSEADPSPDRPASVQDAQDTLPDGAVLSALSGVKLSDATARSRVTAAGIAVVSSGNCTNPFSGALPLNRIVRDGLSTVGPPMLSSLT